MADTQKDGSAVLVTLETVRHDHEEQVFIRRADENLGVLGYTEHGPRHVGLVAGIAEDVLLQLGYPARAAEFLVCRFGIVINGTRLL